MGNLRKRIIKSGRQSDQIEDVRSESKSASMAKEHPALLAPMSIAKTSTRRTLEANARMGQIRSNPKMGGAIGKRMMSVQLGNPSKFKTKYNAQVTPGKFDYGT